MRIDAYANLLARVPLFSGLSREQLSTLARMGGLREFAAESVITRRNEPGAATYVLVSGRVTRLPSGGGDPIEFGPGVMMGDLAMLIESHYGDTYSAAADAMALEFTRPVMRAVLDHDPGIAIHFADRIRGRLTAISRELDALAGQLSGDAAEDDGAAGADTEVARGRSVGGIIAVRSPSPVIDLIAAEAAHDADYDMTPGPADGPDDGWADVAAGGEEDAAPAPVKPRGRPFYLPGPITNWLRTGT